MPHHRVAGRQLRPAAGQQGKLARAGHDIGGQRQVDDRGDIGRMIDQAASADLAGEACSAEILDTAGGNQLHRRSPDDKLLGRQDRFGAVFGRTEAHRACADCICISICGPDRGSIVGQAIALGPAHLDRDPSRFGERAPVAPVARPGDKPRMCGLQSGRGEGVTGIAPRRYPDRIPPTGLDDIGPRPQVLVDDVVEQEVGHAVRSPGVKVRRIRSGSGAAPRAPSTARRGCVPVGPDGFRQPGRNRTARSGCCGTSTPPRYRSLSPADRS